MASTTRRNFIKISSTLTASLALSGPDFYKKKYKPLLSFSTLGCPKWTFEQILKCTVENHYDGIELRGILGELYLPKCSELNSKENIAATRKRVEDKGKKIVDLGSSATLHFPEGAERQKNLEEGKRFIDLAHGLNCPNVRVYPNNFPKGQDRDKTLDLISKGLLDLGSYAKNSGVRVLMETHGEVLWSDVILQIMKTAEHPNVGIVWDIFNMWEKTKESPAMVHEKLKKYIYHVHVKDAKIIDGKNKFVMLGMGETPLNEAFKALSKSKFKGYYSFEWEKLWHPEIDEPENVLPVYPKVMMKYF